MKPSVTLLATISGASSRTSGALELGDYTVYSITVIFTGSNLAGTLALEVSRDGTTFIALASSTQAITASANHMWTDAAAGYRYVRATWTATSGTGNITITGDIKEPFKPST